MGELKAAAEKLKLLRDSLLALDKGDSFDLSWDFTIDEEVTRKTFNRGVGAFDFLLCDSIENLQLLWSFQKLFVLLL